MKKMIWIMLLPLVMLTGCSHEKKEMNVSALYQHYAERENLSVAQVSGFELNDSVCVDVVLMQADNEEAWQQLKEEENPAIRTQWNGTPVMRVIASLYKHTIGIYRIDNETQYDAIVEYQLEKTKKGTK